LNSRVSFHLLAEQELNDACLYYEDKSTGLGSAFLEAIVRALDDIRKYPRAASPAAESVRRKLVRRFPYAILYSVRGDTIRVLAIAHQMRRPLYWRGRS
jgi:plasmid stabilization system protein ParE